MQLSYIWIAPMQDNTRLLLKCIVWKKKRYIFYLKFGLVIDFLLGALVRTLLFLSPKNLLFKKISDHIYIQNISKLHPDDVGCINPIMCNLLTCIYYNHTGTCMERIHTLGSLQLGCLIVINLQLVHILSPIYNTQLHYWYFHINLSGGLAWMKKKSSLQPKNAWVSFFQKKIKRNTYVLREEKFCLRYKIKNRMEGETN